MKRTAIDFKKSLRLASALFMSACVSALSYGQDATIDNTTVSGAALATDAGFISFEVNSFADGDCYIRKITLESTSGNSPEFIYIIGQETEVVSDDGFGSGPLFFDFTSGLFDTNPGFFDDFGFTGVNTTGFDNFIDDFNGLNGVSGVKSLDSPDMDGFTFVMQRTSAASCNECEYEARSTDATQLLQAPTAGTRLFYGLFLNSTGDAFATGVEIDRYTSDPSETTANIYNDPANTGGDIDPTVAPTVLLGSEPVIKVEIFDEIPITGTQTWNGTAWTGGASNTADINTDGTDVILSGNFGSGDNSSSTLVTNSLTLNANTTLELSSDTWTAASITINAGARIVISGSGSLNINGTVYNAGEALGDQVWDGASFADGAGIGGINNAEDNVTFSGNYASGNSGDLTAGTLTVASGVTVTLDDETWTVDDLVLGTNANFILSGNAQLIVNGTADVSSGATLSSDAARNTLVTFTGAEDGTVEITGAGAIDLYKAFVGDGAGGPGVSASINGLGGTFEVTALVVEEAVDNFNLGSGSFTFDFSDYYTTDPTAPVGYEQGFIGAGLFNGGAGSETITIKKQINGNGRRGYRFMSFPVNNSGANGTGDAGFAENIIDGLVYSYNAGVLTDTEDYRSGYAGAVNTPLDNKLGYAIYMDPGATFTMTGPTYNPTVGAALFYSLNFSDFGGALAAGDRGWNLIGNPTLSTLDLNAFLGALGGGTTAYFWDPQSRSFTEVLPAANASLAPMQGFFIQVSSTLGPNPGSAIRGAIAPEGTTPSFFRANDEQIDGSQFRVLLRSEDQDNYDSRVRVRFDETYTDGFEENEDIYRLLSLSEVRPEAYFEDAEGSKFSRMALPRFNGTRTLPLSFHVGTDGDYSLELEDAQADLPVVQVVLEDQLTGAVHNFADGAYRFTAQAGQDEGRFLLHFVGRVTALEDGSLESNLNVYAKGRSLFFDLRNATANTLAVEVFNVAGQRIGKPVTFEGNDRTHRLDLDGAAEGVYIVRAVAGDGSRVVRKVYVR